MITGTDTSVGKTLIAAAIAHTWTRQSRRVGVLKPVETGCADGPPLDALALRAAAGDRHPLDLVCPLHFRTPASPHTAALLEGRPPPTLDAILRSAALLAADSDVLLIESAGGLLVPLAPGLLFVDVAAALGAPVLIVARTRLGTLNHTLLTLEALARRALPLAGIVLNATEASAGPEENLVANRLADHSDARLFGHVPHLGLLSRTPEQVAPHLDLEGLWELL